MRRGHGYQFAVNQEDASATVETIDFYDATSDDGTEYDAASDAQDEGDISAMVGQGEGEDCTVCVLAVLYSRYALVLRYARPLQMHFPRIARR